MCYIKVMHAQRNDDAIYRRDAIIGDAKIRLLVCAPTNKFMCLVNRMLGNAWFGMLAFPFRASTFFS